MPDQPGLEGIAIIGMACRFPGADNLAEFWQLLKNGEEHVKQFSDEELLAAGVDPKVLAGRSSNRAAGGILRDIEYFDADFFGINRREAEVIAPEHRLFLQACWEAFEDAGCDPRQFQGSIGVFAGSHNNEYFTKHLATQPGALDIVGEFLPMLGNEKDYLSMRVAYKFGLRGPAISVLTSCSTSMVSICLACQNLMAYQCDAALAGGATVMLPQVYGDRFPEAGITSADGHCRAFDAAASGTSFSNGLGVVLLKRLEDAVRDRDPIYAVIKGFATNNDGADKVSFGAPSVDGQAEVISMAMAMADFSPESISYVEAHGTGTRLGDPIEITALTQAFGPDLPRQSCPIGSVKTNIGHTAPAAGVAGLIKTVLALQHEAIPPSLNYQNPNPEIDFQNSPFFVNTALRPWPRGHQPRRAGISSFGVGGTNAHVVIEDAPSLELSSDDRAWQILPLSARTMPALERRLTQLGHHLASVPDLRLFDAAWTLQTGRRHFQYRRFAVAQSPDQAIEELAKLHGTAESVSPETPPRVVFMFPGQGSQQVNMGRELFESNPVFRAELKACAAGFSKYLENDLLASLYPEGPVTDAMLLDSQQTAWAQPALFAIEYSMAKTLMSWGVQPQALIGHSIGEYVAACLAGVFQLPDALRLVARRSQLMQSMAPGTMAAVFASEVQLKPLLEGTRLSIAAVNGPQLCVVSGESGELKLWEARLKAGGIELKFLHTSHAFHSWMMDPALHLFRREFESVQLGAPAIPFISNVTGEWIAESDAISPDYWVQHLRSTVRFADGIRVLMEAGFEAFVESGPGRTLGSLVKQQPAEGKPVFVQNTMRAPNESASDAATLLRAAGNLWQLGMPMDWSKLHGDRTRRKISLPTYPFEKLRCWIEPGCVPKTPTPIATVPGRFDRQDFSEWFYLPTWRGAAPVDSFPLSSSNRAAEGILLFENDLGICTVLREKLEASGCSIIRVSAGHEFQEQGDRAYTIRPGNEGDYGALFLKLSEKGQLCSRIVHLWGLSDFANVPETSRLHFDGSQLLGFYSALNIAKAIARNAASLEFELKFVVNHSCQVGVDEPLSPSVATLTGAILSIPQEHLGSIRCSLVDLGPEFAGLTKDSSGADLLVAEVLGRSEAAQVALRLGRRWTRDYERKRFIPGQFPSALREGGVYLFTGGFSKMAMILAEHLATQYRAGLILLSRTPFPIRSQWDSDLARSSVSESLKDRIRFVQRLEKLGARVVVLSADVANAHALKAAVHAGVKQFGFLNGVIHTAGNVDPATFKPARQLSQAECEMQFLPKVDGLLNLHAALEGIAFDFCLVTSSLASFLGGMGYSAYAAANAFMDAFALEQGRRGKGRWLSVNWDEWHFIQEQAGKKNVGLFHGAATIRAEEGVRAFEHILSLRGCPQVAVATVDLIARHGRYVLLETPPGPKPPSEPSKESRGTVSEAPPAALTGGSPSSTAAGAMSEMADLWKKVLGVSQVKPVDNFFELGGHSLLAARLLSFIEKRWNIRLTLATFYENQTLESLARLIPGQESVAKPTPVLPVDKTSASISAPLHRTTTEPEPRVETGVQDLFHPVACRDELVAFLSTFENEQRGASFWHSRLAYWWDKNPATRTGSLAGWVLREAGRIVGFMGAIPYVYTCQGLPLDVLVTTTWRIDRTARKASVEMYMKVVRMLEENVAIDTSPTEDVVPLLERSNFRAQRQVDRFFFPTRSGLGMLIGVTLGLTRPSLAALPSQRRLVTLQDSFTVPKGWIDSQRLEKLISKPYLEWQCSSPVLDFGFLGCADPDGRLTSYVIVQADTIKGMRAGSVIDFFTLADGPDEIAGLLRALCEDPERLPQTQGAKLMVLHTLGGDMFKAPAPWVYSRPAGLRHYYSLPPKLAHLAKRSVLAEGDYGC